MKNLQTVCVVGLGRIGLPTAAICARAGHDVIAVDHDPDVLQAIRSRALPYEEPGLELGRLDLGDSVKGVGADVFLLCIGTTVKGEVNGAALTEIGKSLPSDALVLVESTVPPGTCHAIAEVGPQLVAHCPERARPGSVLGDFATLPRLIGGVTPEATSRAVEFFRTLTDAPLVECAAAEAELAKLAENAEREVRIAFANEVGDRALALGLDSERVMQLANTHPRADLMRPGVGVGGECLPMATRFFARQSDGVASAARAMHERRPALLADRIGRSVAPGAQICVLGRTYRANTRYHQSINGDDPYASPAVALIAELRELGLRVTSYDPSDDDVTLTDAIKGASMLVVAVAHDEFRHLDTDLPVMRLAT